MSNFNTCGYGSITDGSYKLEVQINEYDNNNFFEKGQEIELKGYIKLTSNLLTNLN